MKRTTRNAVEAKKTIIERSAPIFNKHGYAGTRMDMIIEATGYQKGGIYKHFASKLDLAQAVFLHNYSKLKEAYQLCLTEHEGPKEQLLAFIQHYKYFIRNAPVQGGCPILNTAIESDDTTKELRILARDALNEWIDLITWVIRRGQNMGVFRSEPSAKSSAQFLIATIEGAIMMGKIKRDAALMTQTADLLLEYVHKQLVEPH